MREIGLLARGLLAVAPALAGTGQAQGLFISEYVEGSGHNRALEILNLGPANVHLGQYRIDIFEDGKNFTALEQLWLDNVILAPFEVHVLAHPFAALPGAPDQTSILLKFDGNDAVALTGPGGVVDAIGEIGFNPGQAWMGGGFSTKNQTLRRKEANCGLPTVGVGRFDPSKQWNGFAVNDFTDLGLPPAGLVTVECGPGFTSYCTAGTSASGCRATISATGAPSAWTPSGFVLTAKIVEGARDGIFFFGSNGRQALPWGNGGSFRCVVPPVKRTGLLPGVGTNGACDGQFSIDLNAHWCPTCPKPAQNPGAGAVVQAQLWYRDPFSASNKSTSFSDAVEFHVGL